MGCGCPAAPVDSTSGVVSLMHICSPKPMTPALISIVCICMCCAVQYEQLVAEIEQIGGVVTHGLLLNAADAVVIADQKEGVKVIECEKQPAAAAAGSS